MPDVILEDFFTEMAFKKYFCAFNSSVTKNVLLHQLSYIFVHYPKTFFPPCNNDNQKHSTKVTLIALITNKK